MLQTVMRAASALISLYMIVIFIRIVITWFRGATYGKAMDVLASITDPYLNFFRRFTFLRIGNIDFSPVIAIIALSVLSNIFTTIGFAGHVTVGLVFAMVISALASAAGFFLVIFLALAGMRLVAMAVNANTASRFWIIIDQILEPITYRFAQTVNRGRPTSYRHALLLFVAVLVVTLILGKVALGALVGVLARLPF